VHLQGPPFGGYAHVHFYFCGFTVYFGDQNNTPDPIGYDDFISLVQQPGPGSKDEKTGLIVLSLSEGTANDKNTSIQKKPGDEWVVRPGDFKFRVECKVPVTAMDYNDGVKHFGNFAADTEKFYARQMHTSGEWVSVLTVSIVPHIRPANEDTVDGDKENPWQVTPIEKQMPRAIWAQCKQPC
jgi:hypothetical protein